MDEQTYQIVLSPDFGISPEEFAQGMERNEPGSGHR